MCCRNVSSFLLLACVLTELERCKADSCDNYCGACYNGCDISQSNKDIVGSVVGSSSSWYYCLNDLKTYEQLSNYEIRMIGAYEGENGYYWNGAYYGTITVDLKSCIDYDFDYYSDVFTKPTILFLTSYYPVNWIIDSSDWIVLKYMNLVAIYVSSVYYKNCTIDITNDVLRPNHSNIEWGDWGYGYGNDCGNGNIHDLLKAISNAGNDVYSFLGMLEIDSVSQCVGKQSNQYVYTTQYPIGYSTTTTKEEDSSTSALVFDLENEYEKTVTILAIYSIGAVIFTMLFCMSMCHTKYKTFNHIRALQTNDENSNLRHPLSLLDLIKLLFNTDRIDVASLCFETTDIASDVWLAATLVESNQDFDDNPSTNNKQLFWIGVASFLFALFGILCFLIKLWILKHLFVIIYYDKINFDKHRQNIKVNLIINGKNKEYNKTLVHRDVLMWDIFTGAVEAIPQTLIAITVMIVAGDATASSVVSVFTSTVSIVWKVVGLCLNVNFGSDETIPIKERSLQDVKSNSRSQVSPVSNNNANIIQQNDISIDHKAQQRLKHGEADHDDHDILEMTENVKLTCQ